MNQIMYLVGLVAITLLILGYLGLQLSAPVLAIVSTTKASAFDHSSQPDLLWRRYALQYPAA